MTYQIHEVANFAINDHVFNNPSRLWDTLRCTREAGHLPRSQRLSLNAAC